MESRLHEGSKRLYSFPALHTQEEKACNIPMTRRDAFKGGYRIKGISVSYVGCLFYFVGIKIASGQPLVQTTLLKLCHCKTKLSKWKKN